MKGKRRGNFRGNWQGLVVNVVGGGRLVWREDEEALLEGKCERRMTPLTLERKKNERIPAARSPMTRLRMTWVWGEGKERIWGVFGHKKISGFICKKRINAGFFGLKGIFCHFGHMLGM